MAGWLGGWVGLGGWSPPPPPPPAPSPPLTGTRPKAMPHTPCLWQTWVEFKEHGTKACCTPEDGKPLMYLSIKM